MKFQMFGLKIITSFLPYFVILVFMILIFSIYHIIFYFTTNQNCGRTGFLLYSRVYSYVLVFIQLLLLGCIVIFDLIFNIQLLIRNPFTFLKEYFIKKDPYFFRFEMLLYVFVFLFNASLQVTGAVLDVVSSQLDATQTALKENIDTYFEIERLIPDALLILVVFGFPLTLTIIKMIQTKYFTILHDQEVALQNLEKLLKDELGYNSFFEFCQNEWSVENIKFWKDVEVWMKNPTRESAIGIFNTYLNGSLSPLEVNVTRREIIPVREAIDNLDVELEATLFAKLHEMVKVNLSDTYSRFIITREHEIYLQTMEFKDGLIKDFK
jgi:hypothetical protein